MKRLTYAFAIFALMAISYTLGAISHPAQLDIIDHTDGEVQTELIMTPEGKLQLEVYYAEMDAIELD